MFDIVYATPAAAVPTSGTIAFSYPAGKNAGSYAAYGHKAQVRGLQNALSQDDGHFSLAFTSVITLTYNGATSIPAGSLVSLQVNARGQDDGDPSTVPLQKRMVSTNIVRIDLGAPAAAAANAISLSQTVGAAGSFLLNGATLGVLDVPRAVVGAWTTNSILTITGVDEYGDVIIEVTPSSTTTHTGKKAFKKITSIVSSAGITSATIGTSDVLGLPVYVDKVQQVVEELQDDVRLARFANKVTLPYNFDQVDLLAPTAQRLTAPSAGYVTGLDGTVVAAVTTGGAITVECNTVAVVGLSITVADAAAAGVQHTDTVLKIPTGLCAAGDDITVTPAAAFATAGRYQGHVTFEPLVAANGTFVAGVQTLPTGTTGDVKGTYDPAELCDGSKFFSLLVQLPDPNYRGVDNYDG